MHKTLEEDLNLMQDGGDREIHESWKRAMERLLTGEERRRIRENWLRQSSRPSTSS